MRCVEYCWGYQIRHRACWDCLLYDGTLVCGVMESTCSIIQLRTARLLSFESRYEASRPCMEIELVFQVIDILLDTWRWRDARLLTVGRLSAGEWLKKFLHGISEQTRSS